MVPIFRFVDLWRISASPVAVYSALADVQAYPRWWPQIRSVQRLTATSGELTCRSVLPYVLHLTVRRDLEDRGESRLRVLLSGDLVGWSAWRVIAEPDTGSAAGEPSEPSGRCRALFAQEVTAPGIPGGGSALLRPILDWNHAMMMRAGERGLRKHLSEGDQVSSSRYFGNIARQVGHSWSKSPPQSSTRFGIPLSPRA